MEKDRKVEISLLQESEIDEVIAFYNNIYKTDRTREKFIWEFLEAPAGKAIYVIARDLEHNNIVGTQCAIPIELLTDDGAVVLSAKSEATGICCAGPRRPSPGGLHPLRAAGAQYLGGAFTDCVHYLVERNDDRFEVGLQKLQRQKCRG